MRYVHRDRSARLAPEDGVDVLDVVGVREDTHVFVYSARNAARHGPSYEALTDDLLRYFFVPRCPGCGKSHEQKRVGNSLTFMVKVEQCTWKGSIQLPDRPPADAMAYVPRS